MAITLAKEVEERLIASIKRYFEEQMDEEIGDLKAELLLDLFIRQLGPPVYNQAIKDAHKFIQEKLHDLEDEYYALEGNDQ